MSSTTGAGDGPEPVIAEMCGARDVAARAFPVFDALEAWLSEDLARGVLVVAHNHVNRLRLTALLEWPMSSYRRRVSQDPAAYSIIGVRAGERIVRRLNVRPR